MVYSKDASQKAIQLKFIDQVLGDARVLSKVYLTV